MQKMKRRQDKELEQMMAFELKMQEIQTERDKRAELEKRKGRGRNQTAFEARFSFARGAVLLHISATILAIVRTMTSGRVPAQAKTRRRSARRSAPRGSAPRTTDSAKRRSSRRRKPRRRSDCR